QREHLSRPDRQVDACEGHHVAGVRAVDVHHPAACHRETVHAPFGHPALPDRLASTAATVNTITLTAAGTSSAGGAGRCSAPSGGRSANTGTNCPTASQASAAATRP